MKQSKQKHTSIQDIRNQWGRLPTGTLFVFLPVGVSV